MMLRSLAVSLAFLLLPIASQASAQSFMLSPGTIIFEEGARSAELLIGNTGDQKALMRIEAAHFIMDEKGQLTEAPVSDARRRAQDLLRFSPRQFELKPGDNQTVRIGLRKPADLPNGEYRVHLRVVNVANGTPSAKIAGKNGELGLVIPINVARAVRVLVRQGVSAGTAAVQSVSAKRNGDYVSIKATLQRSGGGSSSGDYSIMTPNGVKPVTKGSLSIYADRETRVFETSVLRSALNGQNTLCILYTDSVGKNEKRYCTMVENR